jgi:hypothetical protein
VLESKANEDFVADQSLGLKAEKILKQAGAELFQLRAELFQLRAN